MDEILFTVHLSEAYYWDDLSAVFIDFNTEWTGGPTVHCSENCEAGTEAESFFLEITSIALRGGAVGTATTSTSQLKALFR